MEKRTATIADSLLQINPDIKFTYTDEDYETLVILSDHEKPTEGAIESAKVQAQKKIDDTYYKVQRMEEYPSIQELVVALYDEEDKASIIERRNAVKAKYPKPE